MSRRTIGLTLLGGAAGLVVGLMLMGLAAGLFIEESTGAVLLDEATSRSRSQFAVSSGALYFFVIVVSAVGGALIAQLTASAARLMEPDEPRYGAVPITILGVFLTPIVAYAALRAAIGVGGTIEGGVVTLSVFRALVAAAITGASAGAVTGATAERLSRPAVLALEGEAWPRSAARFMRESMAAMGIPVLAILGIFGAVFGLSRALLAGEDAQEFTAVGIAVLVAAAVLGGAAFVASRPPSRSEREE